MGCGKMEIEDDILRQDIEEIAKISQLTERLRQKTVFVTGATGLIGSQIVLALACMNRVSDAKLRIAAMVRSRQKAERIFGKLLECDDIALYYGDINEPIAYEGNVDYIIHGASATSSRYFVTQPVETILTSIEGAKHILEFAKSKNVESMVYLSSLEVYGTPDGGRQLISETDYGYMDPTSVRSSYSEGKRMVECLCASYAKEYGVPVKMARLSQTFGAGVEYQDSRVFAEFARCAIEKKDIVLHTQGNTVRSYCYTKDSISAILWILLYGGIGEAYNVTNMDTAISIKDMAELVCATFPEAGIQVKIEIPEDVSAFGYNPEMVIRLDSSKLQALGWNATVDLSDMFRRMVKSMSCATIS